MINRYLKAESNALDEEGYFDTGDLATIDDAGNLTIGGRAKDLIKSGGERINPTEIETVIGTHPSIRDRRGDRASGRQMGERPVLIVEREGDTGEARGLIDLLRQGRRFLDPDQVVDVATMPLAATGKIDKVRLTADLAAGRITPRRIPR